MMRAAAIFTWDAQLNAALGPGEPLTLEISMGVTRRFLVLGSLAAAVCTPALPSSFAETSAVAAAAAGAAAGEAAEGAAAAAAERTGGACTTVGPAALGAAAGARGGAAASNVGPFGAFMGSGTSSSASFGPSPSPKFTIEQ